SLHNLQDLAVGGRQNQVFALRYDARRVPKKVTAKGRRDEAQHGERDGKTALGQNGAQEKKIRRDQASYDERPTLSNNSHFTVSFRRKPESSRCCTGPRLPPG